MSLKISVIIPCYNVSAYINDCLASVLEQTYTNYEIICVDDGSSDNTIQLLNDFKQNKYNELQVLTQTNKGASTARNLGLSVASGDYVQFLDADDLIMPDKLTNQISLIEKNNFPSIVVGSAVEKNEKNEIVKRRNYQERPSNIWLNLLNADLGDTCANLFKKSVLVSVGGWNENLKSSQEYDLMFRILKNNQNIVFDSLVNTIIKVRSGGSISKTNVKDNWVRFINLRVQIIDYLKSNKIEFDIKQAYQIVFDAIRFLYAYDNSAAIDFFKKTIPADFKPQQSNATGKLYLMLYDVFGFSLTEKIKSFI